VSAPGRVTGTDGKSYRSAPLTTAERSQAIRMAHVLCHEQGLSIRAARRIMAARYGVFRSTGAIAADLAAYVCPRCDDE
jgi:hypothetical protein